MNKAISVEQINEAIGDLLGSYNREISEAIKVEAKNAMAQLVSDTKATAPVGKRKKHYRDSIKSKKVSESNDFIRYVWYVAGSDYRLSHLLENGHALRDGGRVEGTHFIQNASEPIIESYIKAVEEAIKRNG